MIRTHYFGILFALALIVGACGDSPSQDGGPDRCQGDACSETDTEPQDTGDASGEPEDADGDALDGSGDVADADGDALDGSDDADTEDLPPPPLSFTITPADGEMDVPLDVVIEVQFNQPMRGEQMYAGTISLQPLHGEPVLRKILYDSETWLLTIAPPDDGQRLRPLTPYTLRLADNISSTAGQSLGQPVRSAFTTQGFPGGEQIHALAMAYAPTVYQQVEEAKFDAFTRIDFDGNDNPADNLRNTRSANYASAYYSVIETKTHHFITYLFYYPGVTIRTAETREHDFVSVQVVVKKEATDPLGTLRAFSTFYHEHVNVWTMETGWYGSDGAPSGNKEPIAGRLPSSWLEGGRHISLYVRSGRHDVCLPTASANAGNCSPATGTESAPFARNTTGGIFRPGTNAQRLGDNATPTYTLIPFVDEYWSRRNSVGEGAIFGGELTYRAPSTEGSGTLRPGEGLIFPSGLNFGWDKGSWGELPFSYNWGRDLTHTGAWMVDPAWAHNRLMNFGENFSLDYCFNPYLGIDERGAHPMCSTVVSDEGPED